jgi:hypothetical protein
MLEKEFLYQIDGIFSPLECQQLIEKADKIGWKTIDRGIALYDRAIMLDQGLADNLYAKIKHLLPETFRGDKIIGVNSHFRFSKYLPGGRFEIHRDGINIADNGDRAVMTLNIFLNVPEEGGSTIFYKEPQNFSRELSQRPEILLEAKPKEGRGALFYNQILHEGSCVTKGLKYLIRTDVMVQEPSMEFSFERQMQNQHTKNFFVNY